jgi:hypothetical protein
VVASLSGLSVFLAGLLAYSYALASTPVATPESTSYLTSLAEAFLLLVIAGVAIAGLGIRGFVRERMEQVAARGLSPLSPGWMIPYLLSLARYRRYFWGSVIVYGLFYAYITSMLVYQATVDFASAYGAAIPSVVVTPVGAAPLFTPVVTVYLTDHLGLLLIPLTILLVVGISVLVGVNVTMAAFAFGNRARGGRGWLGGVGAVVGLFTGCPTCAGLFFANVLGGTGAVSFATILGYYQPAFILLSIPVLVAAPYLTSRSLSKVFRDGCVYLQSGGATKTSL